MIHWNHIWQAIALLFFLLLFFSFDDSAETRVNKTKPHPVDRIFNKIQLEKWVNPTTK